MSDSITVTCRKCNHSIKAPREAAGKYGKCPSCQSPVYVPTPSDEIEEIPLAPLAGDQPQASDVNEESKRLTAALLRESELAEESKTGGAGAKAKPPKATSKRGKPAKSSDTNESGQGRVSVGDAVIEYLLALQNSDLEESERIAELLRGSQHQAKSKVQQLMVDAMPPPALKQMPEALYQGFLKKLLAELS